MQEADTVDVQCITERDNAADVADVMLSSAALLAANISTGASPGPTDPAATAVSEVKLIPVLSTVVSNGAAPGSEITSLSEVIPVAPSAVPIDATPGTVFTSLVAVSADANQSIYLPTTSSAGPLTPAPPQTMGLSKSVESPYKSKQKLTKQTKELYAAAQVWQKVKGPSPGKVLTETKHSQGETVLTQNSFSVLVSEVESSQQTAWAGVPNDSDVVLGTAAVKGDKPVEDLLERSQPQVATKNPQSFIADHSEASTQNTPSFNHPATDQNYLTGPKSQWVRSKDTTQPDIPRAIDNPTDKDSPGITNSKAADTVIYKDNNHASPIATDAPEREAKTFQIADMAAAFRQFEQLQQSRTPQKGPQVKKDTPAGSDTILQQVQTVAKQIQIEKTDATKGRTTSQVVNTRQTSITTRAQAKKLASEQAEPFTPPKYWTKDGHPAITFKKSDERRWLAKEELRQKEKMRAQGFPYDDKG